MAKLDFDTLWKNHPTNRSDQLPCRRANGVPTYKNQCAVRMSICLRDSGVTSQQLGGLIHCGVHPYEEMHFIRAQQLANKLAASAGRIDGLGSVQKLVKEKPAQFADELFGRRGLVFLMDYWARRGESERGAATGDHIDLWNGYSTTASWLMEYFSWLGYYGGYDKSKQIWFWPVES